MRCGETFGGDSYFLLVPWRRPAESVGEGSVISTGPPSTPPPDPGADLGTGEVLCR